MSPALNTNLWNAIAELRRGVERIERILARECRARRVPVRKVAVRKDRPLRKGTK